MDRIHHKLERGVDKCSCFFRIEPFDERRGAFEIGKQCRDGFTLAVGGATGFQCGLLRPNTFGEMSRSPATGVRSPESRVWGLGIGNWELTVGN
jgi:hypothetical protein